MLWRLRRVRARDQSLRQIYADTCRLLGAVDSGKIVSGLGAANTAACAGRSLFLHLVPGASPGKTGVLHNIRTATFAAWPCLSQKSSFFERDSGRQFPYQLTHKRRVAGTHPLAAEAGYRS